MNKSIKYVTYQTFPAETANSLQTISNIKYLVQNNINVELYFPLREKQSSSELQELQNQYNFKEEFKVVGIKHKYLHGKINFLKPFWYNLSHILWSKKVVQNFFKHNTSDVFFTRSDWLAYYLAKQGSIVVFEVHQVSKVRNYVISKIKNFKNVKFIFLNQELSNYYLTPKQSLILHNGVDTSLYSNSELIKRGNHIIYLGKLSRFNQPRGINQIIHWFNDFELKENYTLEIVGGNTSEVDEINKLIQKLNLTSVVTVSRWLNRKEAIKRIENSSIGLLVNSNLNTHSKYYTSPLKYFEYLYAKVKVVAVDFPSHRALPFSTNISFFDENSKESFINALRNLKELEQLNIEDLNTITLEKRAKKIIEFIF